MEIIQIVIIGVITSILAVMLKKELPEFALIMGMAAGILIFLLIIPKLSAVLQLIKNITDHINMEFGYIEILFKVVGISYLAEFGMQLCLDAGESAIASKIELAGKILIMVTAAPIILTLMDLILTMA